MHFGAFYRAGDLRRVIDDADLIFGTSVPFPELESVLVQGPGSEETLFLSHFPNG